MILPKLSGPSWPSKDAGSSVSSRLRGSDQVVLSHRDKRPQTDEKSPGPHKSPETWFLFPFGLHTPHCYHSALNVDGTGTRGHLAHHAHCPQAGKGTCPSWAITTLFWQPTARSTCTQLSDTATHLVGLFCQSPHFYHFSQGYTPISHKPETVLIAPSTVWSPEPWSENNV